MNNVEYVDIVDENNNVIGKAKREDVDVNNLLARASLIFIFNKKGEILIQKRSMKKRRYSGQYDIGVGETLLAGESYEAGAERGLQEELGIKDVAIEYIFSYQFIGEESKRNYKVYSCVYNGEIRFDDGEVAEARFLTLTELKQLLKTETFTSTGQKGLQIYLERYKT